MIGSSRLKVSGRLAKYTSLTARSQACVQLGGMGIVYSTPAPSSCLTIADIELIASSALARLFIIQVQHFSVVAISHQLDLRLRNRVSQSFGQRFFLCSFQYSVELDLHQLHARVQLRYGLLWRACASAKPASASRIGRAQQLLFGAEAPSSALQTCHLSVFVQPHPKRHLAHHRLIPPAAGEALEVVLLFRNRRVFI